MKKLKYPRWGRTRALAIGVWISWLLNLVPPFWNGIKRGGETSVCPFQLPFNMCLYLPLYCRFLSSKTVVDKSIVPDYSHWVQLCMCQRETICFRLIINKLAKQASIYSLSNQHLHQLSYLAFEQMGIAWHFQYSKYIDN